MPRKGLFIAALGLGLSCSASAWASVTSDEITFEIKEVETPMAVQLGFQSDNGYPPAPPTVENDGTNGNQTDTNTQVPPAPMPLPEEGNDTDGVFSIINLAKTIWQVVKDNAPVADISYDFANALPHNVKAGSELAGFSNLEYRSYRLMGKNMWGSTVYDIILTFVHQHHGSYQGKGSYLETVSVIPSQVTVLWGYKVNIGVRKVTATNVGTAEDPVGALTMLVHFSVSTPLKTVQRDIIAEFRGDDDGVMLVD